MYSCNVIRITYCRTGYVCGHRFFVIFLWFMLDCGNIIERRGRGREGVRKEGGRSEEGGREGGSEEGGRE